MTIPCSECRYGVELEDPTVNELRETGEVEMTERSGNGGEDVLNEILDGGVPELQVKKD